MQKAIIFRKAEKEDFERIWQIILEAKEQMRQMNSKQWQESYPARENIAGDIAKEYAYVLCENGEAIAYAAVIFSGEPAYNRIEGKWLTDFPYVVVHRLAVADKKKNQGIATFFMQQIEAFSRQKGMKSFRVDTNFDNVYMQKILCTLEFTYCGEIVYDQGRRRAYEKILK
ncbi:MAG: GNAT family N-acetyltransferase [Candidatus Azobacteroides sp.]|nr:GNAT family N-acetyltransferase [Candidatus Azobacteroides sp.]